MKRLNIVAAIAIVCVLAPTPAKAQENCSVAPVSADDLATGLDAINEALLCLQRRIQALEAGKGSEAPAAQAAGTPQTLSFGDIQITMDDASVVDKKQVLLEFGVINNGSDPVLALVDDNSSSISLQGETEVPRFAVQGFASCGSKGWNARDVSGACVKRSTDSQWTLLEPGLLYDFRLSTVAGREEIKSDTVSAKIRLLTKRGDDWERKDLSFARVPLRN